MNRSRKPVLIILLHVFLVAFSFTALSVTATAQTRTVTFKESDEDVINPERGFYIPVGTRTSHFEALDPAKLKTWRNAPQRMGKATYRVQVSLLYRAYEFDNFRDRELTDSVLSLIQQDFNAVRAAGLKMVLRFAYTNKSNEGNCGGSYGICPPYGDAPRSVVLRHIAQLKPLLQKNADIVAVLQEGFIGIWGENYFTDYFGDASEVGSGKIPDSSWIHRNEVLAALLDAMPVSRMVQVRTPQIKQKFVYGPSADIKSAPLDSAEGFSGSNNARVGFHNDCFLASDDDYGTYFDNGSTTQPKQPANALLRKFTEADTRYTAVGGETCDDAFSPQNDCAPAGYAEDEFRRMHYSFLNASYNVQVNNDWDSSGCLKTIRRHMGYRLVLRSVTMPSTVRPTDPFKLAVSLDNTGYASPFNPRKVYVVFRNTTTGKEYRVALGANPQQWFSGAHLLNERITLPEGFAAGKYAVFLWLPDVAETIAERPEYAIQLANEGVFEARTGYNDLHFILRVKSF